MTSADSRLKRRVSESRQHKTRPLFEVTKTSSSGDMTKQAAKCVCFLSYITATPLRPLTFK